MRNLVRASHRQMGRPLPVNLMVRVDDHRANKHKPYWTRRSRPAAAQRNSNISIFEKPCLRRYLEFMGQSIPNGLRYEYHEPKTIIPRSKYTWTLLDDAQKEIATFTDVTEAWILHISLQAYREQLTSITYLDRSA